MWVYPTHVSPFLLTISYPHGHRGKLLEAMFVYGCPLGCGQLALDEVHHPSWANTSSKIFRYWVKRENPFSAVAWLVSGAGPGQSDEVSFGCTEEQSRCMGRLGWGVEYSAFTGSSSNYFSWSTESLPSPFGMKSSYFTTNSLFLPYSNNFSYNKNDPLWYRGYMLLFICSSKRKERSVERRGEDNKKDHFPEELGRGEVWSTTKRYAFLWDR